MVSIVVQNFVEIDEVVSITWNFKYFARLAWKRLFTPQKLGFLSTKPPKGTFLRESASFEPSNVKIRRRDFWANGWNITNFLKFIYTFFSWTHLQVRPVDGFSPLMVQTTRIRARMCLLGVSLTLLPILGVKYPQNPNFGGVNRRFQAKRAKYWKFYVIENNASISAKFCTTIETIKN